MNPLRSRVAAALASALLCLPAAAADLTVSAAASLTNAFNEIAPLFEAQHPGTTVRLNYGASGTLLQQIVKGAPVDVFASADEETMDQAQARALIRPEQRRDFVSNSLVVIVPTAATSTPQSIGELTRPAYARIAIGVPASVPVGRYTQSVLQQAGLWSAIEPKTIGAQNVRQALDYVARGEVDAGFVYGTDAALLRDKVRIALTVPTPKPVRYPIAPIAAPGTSAGASPGGDPALAQAFVDFVLSPPAQAVLARYGFGKP